jgi:hypothetical protein
MSGIEDIAEQLGHAVLAASSGEVVKAAGDLQGDEATLRRLYQIFVDSVRSVADDSFHRLSITFNTYTYIVTMGVESNGDKLVYILKAPSQ